MPDNFDHSNDPDYNSILVNDLKCMNHNINDDIDLIWEDLNTRLHNKFGNAEEISKSTSYDSISWARMILPAYLNWDRMKSTHMMLEFWKRKISRHFNKISSGKSKDKKSSDSDEANENSANDESEDIGVSEINKASTAGKY